MKRIFFYLIFTCLLSVAVPNNLKAIPDSLTVTASAEKAEVARLTDRLEEIKLMDKSVLTRQERKTLRQEVKAIEQELKTMGGGIYISAGLGVVILLLLLIIML